MTREKLIDLEVKFTDEWYKEHTGVPTYADAIEWEEKRMIAKAVRWLKDQEEMIGISFEEDFLERFKEAMEE